MEGLKKCLEELTRCDVEIAAKLDRIAELRKVKAQMETEEQDKLENLMNLKKQCLILKSIERKLIDRNQSLGNEFTNSTEEMTQNVGDVGDANILKILGLKVRINDFENAGEIIGSEIEEDPEENEETNLLEVTFEFTETNIPGVITLAYDINSADFDLLELNPTLERFTEIKSFLRETKDLQGLLSTYKNWLDLSH